MGRTRYKIYEVEYPYFLTSSVVKGYPIFSNPLAAEAVMEGLIFLQQYREVKLYAYVLMENHLHLVARSTELSNHMRAFKSWTARTIIDRFTQTGHTLQLARLRKAKRYHNTDSIYQVWQKGFFPKQIPGDSVMIQKIRYIHDNPVKRGYVDRPEDWRYSSARNYLGLDGIVPVTLFGR